jgi:hypothetical protein
LISFERAAPIQALPHCRLKIVSERNDARNKPDQKPVPVE